MSKLAKQVTATPRKKGLGRGLGAIINDGISATPPREPAAAADPVDPTAAVVRQIEVERIKANEWQPRSRFDEKALAELADSIRVHGILQPLLVRGKSDGYELLAGERRLRAAGIAGLTKVPVIIMEAGDNQAAELALIENLQRENLDALEEAHGYRVLMDRFGLTQEEIARQVGRARATVANALRLLTLPERIRNWLAEGSIAAGHAKLLLGIEIAAEQEDLARRVIKEALSVRQLENIIQRRKAAPRKARASQSDLPAAHIATLSDRLHAHFGTSVRIFPSKTYANGKKSRGRLEVDFHSNDELQRLLEIIGVSVD